MGTLSMHTFMSDLYVYTKKNILFLSASANSRKMLSKRFWCQHSLELHHTIVMCMCKLIYKEVDKYMLTLTLYAHTCFLNCVCVYMLCHYTVNIWVNSVYTSTYKFENLGSKLVWKMWMHKHVSENLGSLIFCWSS